jgi:hypothetical protein
MTALTLTFESDVAANGWLASLTLCACLARCICIISCRNFAEDLATSRRVLACTSSCTFYVALLKHHAYSAQDLAAGKACTLFQQLLAVVRSKVCGGLYTLAN